MKYPFDPITEDDEKLVFKKLKTKKEFKELALKNPADKFVNVISFYIYDKLLTIFINSNSDGKINTLNKLTKSKSSSLSFDPMKAKVILKIGNQLHQYFNKS
jgi:hypothetical protein